MKIGNFFFLLLGILLLSSCMTEKKAFRLIDNPKGNDVFRSAFISEVIFQSECAKTTTPCTIQTPCSELSNIACQALKTSINTIEYVGNILGKKPKPTCPLGIWEPPFLINFLEDPTDFNVEDIRIINKQNQVIADLGKRIPLGSQKEFAFIQMRDKGIKYAVNEEVNLQITGKNPKTGELTEIDYPIKITVSRN
ncbi:MAG: hypothetical protein AAGJ18_15840 [Bacteroidota bacterium]